MITQAVSRENAHRHDPKLTCPYCGKQCEGSCGGLASRKPAQHITIVQHGRRWNWQRHTPGTIWTSRDSYATELAAAIDAIEIARCYGVAVHLPSHLRPAVAEHYRDAGRVAYLRGETLDACRNEFERLGWTLASLADARLTTEAAAPFVVESELKVQVYA